ncbi:MAG: GAF domain-containing protein [Gammaproteobacteria bacterium]|nr:GAF domain-containing protein [Gammaproteobacteria bacterium]MBQ0775231.1 GAF domain-containing protein [Gammaproteobacteria bacterium]
MSGAELRHWCEGLLQEGRDRLATDIGIVSCVVGSGYTIVAVKAKNKVFCAGDTFALQETYCREVVRTGQSVALTDVEDVPGLQRHPLYMPMMLEAYVAAPIFHQGKVWGTVNYTSMRVRTENFSDEEVAYVERQGQAISEALKSVDLE